MRAVLTALLIGFLAPTAAFADDAEAKKCFEMAKSLWDEEDYTRCLDWAQKGADAALGKTWKLNCRYLIGRIHHVKTGDWAEALKHYNYIVRKTVGDMNFDHRKLKALALKEKGIILYSQNELTPAVTCMVSSHKIYPTAINADALSQLVLRVGRDKSKSQNARTHQLSMALKMAEEAVLRIKRGEKGISDADNARFHLQLAIAQLANGKSEEAEKTFATINQEHFGPNHLYQRALYANLKGEDPAKVAELLSQTLVPAVRPTAKSRNRMRMFIRNEPDFLGHIKRDEWRKMLTLEKEPKKKKPRSQPASRPSR